MSVETEEKKASQASCTLASISLLPYLVASLDWSMLDEIFVNGKLLLFFYSFFFFPSPLVLSLSLSLYLFLFLSLSLNLQSLFTRKKRTTLHPFVAFTRSRSLYLSFSFHSHFPSHGGRGVRV